MRYLSDDGKVFNNEQDCCEYEQKIKEEVAKKEKLEKERKSRLEEINKKKEELDELILSYKKDYGLVLLPKDQLSSFQNFMDMMCSR